MEYKSLRLTSIQNLHTAFIDAFSEYEVKIEMPIEKLQEMLTTRSFSPELSIGCFDNNQLIGFILTGFRTINNKNCCYDIATGIIKKYQNRKIGSQMVTEIIQMLEHKSINQFQLEVLENNTPAQTIYKKNGFIVSRKFQCYKLDILSTDTNTSFIINNEIDDVFISDLSFMSCVPSWQNSIQSYLNNKNKYSTIGIIEGTQIIGYGIIHKIDASVLQFGVTNNYKNSNIEKLIINLLANSISTKQIRFINIEENSYEDNILQSLGCVLDVKQFEMVYHNKTVTKQLREKTGINCDNITSNVHR